MTAWNEGVTDTDIFMNTKKKFIKINLMYKNELQGGYIERIENFDIEALTDGMEPESEEYFKITTIYLTEKEYRSLPEFTGF